MAVNDRFEEAPKPVTEVPLESEPGDLVIPPSWRDRLSYSKEKRVLVFRGRLARKERKEAQRFSRNKHYKTAVKQIYGQSCGFLNTGVVFVSVFRWVLLLLFALTLEKMADGLCVRMTGEPLFQSLVLLYPFADRVLGSPASGIADQYLVGFLQLVTTILLLVRYYGCLVDQIWRTKVDMGLDFRDKKWQERLADVSHARVLGTASISLIEFVLFYHAALAVPNVRQWLQFLTLIVLVDTLYYFVLPILIGFIRSFPYYVVAGIIRILRLLLTWLSHISEKLSDSTGRIGQALDRIKAEMEVPCLRRAESLFKYGRSAINAYALWNCLDLVTLAIALASYNFSVSVEADLVACVIAASTTVLVSWFNLSYNRDDYRIHIAVLRLQGT